MKRRAIIILSVVGLLLTASCIKHTVNSKGEVWEFNWKRRTNR